MGTPLERFDAWLASQKGQVAVSGHTTRLGLPQVSKTICGLRGWLDDYAKSPRAMKKNWERFLSNNLPSKRTRSNGRRQPTSNTNRKTGEQTF